MDLTADEYKELAALSHAPDVDEATRAEARAAVDAYDNEQKVLDQLDPQYPLMPQALAMAPASTDPKGDEAASQSWLRSGGKDASGTVFVYEPPLALAKKDLLEHPEIMRAIYPDYQGSPEELAKELDTYGEKGVTYQAYADKKWKETADAAANAGKTAYRYSQAPWLHSGSGMSAIKSLGLKALGSVKPASEGINSFVMGVDDTALFGAGRAAQETANPEVQEPNAFLGVDSSGGMPTESAKEHNADTVEAHPVMYALGQGVGLLAPWSATNKAYSIATGGEALAGRLGGKLAARTATSGAAAALAGAGVQAGREAVQGVAQMAQGGPAPDLAEAGGRVVEAGMDPLNIGLGAGGEVISSLAGKGTEWFRNGTRYGGAPGRFEQTGGRFELGKGPAPPAQTQEAIDAARKLDVAPVDVMAKEIAPKVAAEQKLAVEEVTKRVGEENAAYHATNEGQMLLPATKTQETALKLLRKHYAPVEGGQLKPIGDPAAVRKTRALFNNEVQSVSLNPTEGAIALTPDQAEAFLNSEWGGKLIGSTQKKGPKGGPSSPFEKASDLPPEVSVNAPPKGVGTNEPPMAELRGIGPSLVINEPLRTRGAYAIQGQPPKVVEGSNTPMTPPKGDASPARATERPKAISETAEDVRTAGTVPPKGKAKKAAGVVQGKADRDVTPTVHIKEEFGEARNEYGEAMAPFRDAQKADNARAAKLSDEPGMNPDRHIQAEETKVPKDLQVSLDVFRTAKEPLTKHQLQEILGKWGSPEYEVEQLAKRGLIRMVKSTPGGKYSVDSRWELVPGAAVLAASAAGAVSGDDNKGVSAAGAGVVGLAQALKRRGVEKVYVSPRRYNSAQHEQLKETLQRLGSDPSNPAAREAKELYIATLKDRDARPRNGVPGGWSAHQAEHAQQIEAVKARAELAAPGGDAFPSLVKYAQQRPGQMPFDEAMRAAADRAGVRPNIERIRNLDPLKTLQSEMSMGHPGQGGRMVPQTAIGALSRVGDAGMMRFGYPALKALEVSPSIRGGRAGRAAVLSKDEKKKKEARK